MKLIIDINEEDIKVVENTEFTVEELFETTNGRIYRAICKALLNKKTLADMFDNLKTEIRDLYSEYGDGFGWEKSRNRTLNEVMGIIDKYRYEVNHETDN